MQRYIYHRIAKGIGFRVLRAMDVKGGIFWDLTSMQSDINTVAFRKNMRFPSSWEIERTHVGSAFLRNVGGIDLCTSRHVSEDNNYLSKFVVENGGDFTAD
jgi:hypothetical protein